MLYFGVKGEVTGMIRADGAIQCDGLVGSIHQVGRKLMNAPCNGWEHWFYEDEQGERKATGYATRGLSRGASPRGPRLGIARHCELLVVEARMAAELRLLAVFPHPDDETLGLGGTLAKYSAEGVATYLVCATRRTRLV